MGDRVTAAERRKAAAARPRRQTAVIVDAGRPPGTREDGRWLAPYEPSARLADGRVMPMGWNHGQTIPVGTTGTAEYIVTGYAMLWQFTPDAS